MPRRAAVGMMGWLMAACGAPPHARTPAPVPAEATAAYLAGALASQEDAWPEAAAHFEEAAALDPIAAAPALEAARAHWRKGDLSAARHAIDRALDRAPGDAQAWLLRARLGERFADVDVAAAYAQAIALAPDAPLPRWLHLTWTLAQRPAQALAAAQAWATAQPDLADAQLAFARVADAQGQDDDARVAAARAHALAPAWLEPWALSVRLRGQPGDDVAQLRAALEDADDESFTAGFWALHAADLSALAMEVAHDRLQSRRLTARTTAARLLQAMGQPADVRDDETPRASAHAQAALIWLAPDPHTPRCTPPAPTAVELLPRLQAVDLDDERVPDRLRDALAAARVQLGDPSAATVFADAPLRFPETALARYPNPQPGAMHPARLVRARPDLLTAACQALARAHDVDGARRLVETVLVDLPDHAAALRASLEFELATGGNLRAAATLLVRARWLAPGEPWPAQAAQTLDAVRGTASSPPAAN